MGSCCGKKRPVTPVVKQNAYRAQSPVLQRNEEPVKPPPPTQDYSAMQRVNKISLTTTNVLPLIDGYLDEPLTSLEEALQPVDSRMDYLSHYIKQAKTNCHFPSEHNLTRDESAAIYIYTMKWDTRYLYNQLQAAWTSGDRNQLKPWFKYLRLFRSALDKLPNAPGAIWQGVAFNDRLNERLGSQEASFFTLLGSCSPSNEEIKKYLQNNAISKTMLLSYDSVDGKLVTGYTASKSPEVILWPGTKLNVSKYDTVDANGSIIAHLSKKKDPPKRKKKGPPAEKHFVCANQYCDNRCRAHHKPDHCYGFAHLSHSCHHHCGPSNSCFRCGKENCDLRECNKCQSRYCDKCCLK